MAEMKPLKITWAEWQEIRKAPDILERFTPAMEPGVMLLKGLLGRLDGRDLYITDFWATEDDEEAKDAAPLAPKVDASLHRLRLIIGDAYHQGTDGVASEDDLNFLQSYYQATQELLSHARDWAGGFSSENGFIGPHRYAMGLAETVHKLDKLEGCTCPDDDSGDLEEGCPVHDD